GNDNYGVRVVADQKGGKMYHAWTDAKFKAALKEMARWFKEGLVDQQLFTRKENTARKELWTKLNVGGMTHEWVASTGNYTLDKDLLKVVPDFKIEVFAPWGNKGAQGFEEHARVLVKPDGWVVSAQSKNKDTALAFMDWFFSEEGRNTTNFGVQGQTWDKLGPNGHPVFKPEVLDESAKAGGMNRYLWEKHGAQAPLGYFQDYEYERPWTPELAVKGVDLYASKAVKYAYLTPVMTFTKAEQEVVSEITDVLNTFLEESVINMITGKADVDAGWAAYVAKAKELGSDRLVAAYQSAYARYLKSTN
ncbi:MAG: extracellular solute-binding protein, partial [Spirochaetaceae bacterium]|nr:extracellular solute-binding protein [Spirochaetaceae bacterium]